MTSYVNPIVHMDLSDPDVIRMGDDYYMVTSSFTYQPAVPILHSKDLVHWRIVNHVLDSLPGDRYLRPCHGSGAWAPSIRIHEGTVYVFIPLVDEGILVARSDDILGHFETDMLTHEAGWIDPCPLWDDDGRTYMVFAFARSRTGHADAIAIIETDKDFTHTIGDWRILHSGPTAEGPKAYRRGQWHYILFPEGGVATGWQSAIRSRSLDGPWEYRVLLRQGESAVNGPHQGALVDTACGDLFFLHFQDVGTFGRILHLQPARWHDGWPVIGEEGQAVRSGTTTLEEWPCTIQMDDDFTEAELGLQWAWQAKPDKDWYALGDDGLRLFCRSEGGDIWSADNVLSQWAKGPRLVATSGIGLHCDRPGDCISLGMTGLKGGYLSLEEGRLSLYALSAGEHDRLVESVDIEENDIVVRMEADKDSLVFSYSSDGQSFTGFSTRLSLMKGMWTGARIALWATNRQSLDCGGYGKIHYIHFS